MTYEPKEAEEVRDSLQSSLSGKIAKLTNFTDRSFNLLFINAISNYLREIEVKLLASELSGYIEYAGGPITDEDLRRLDIDESVTASELNEYMDDEQLDRLVEVIGVSRDEGNKAQGFIDISTSASSTVVPEGTVVGTSSSSDVGRLNFVTLEERESVDGSTLIVDVPVEAEEVGEEYNIPADEITLFVSPPVGVRGVESSTSIDGGRGVETNDELRERAKKKFSNEPTGGTTRGIRGYIIDEIDEVTSDDIGITEFFDDEPVTVEVTVDGGKTQNIRDAIDESRPVGVKHELIRPKTVSLNVDAQVLGSGVNRSFASSEVEEYLIDELAVGDNFYQNELLKEILNSDSNIINVGQLSVTIDSVNNEQHEYDVSKSVYPIDFNHNGEEFTVFTRNGDGTQTVYEQGVDYQLIDSSGDGYFEKIEWLGVTEPDNEEYFYLDYSVNKSSSVISDEEHTFIDPKKDTIKFDNQVFDYKLSAIPTQSTVSISDEDGVTYTKGTDYNIVNTSTGSNENTFTFSSGRESYELNNSTFADSVTVFSSDSTTFEKGTDYTVVDNDGDGLNESIKWLDSGELPSNEQEFTVEYEINNGLSQTVRWDGSNSIPTAGDVFTVEYQQQVYELNNDIDVVTPDSVSCQCPDSKYTLGTDFRFTDVNADSVKDAIYWIDGGNNPSDETSFFVSYTSKGNIQITEQEKIGASSVTVTER